MNLPKCFLVTVLLSSIPPHSHSAGERQQIDLGFLEQRARERARAPFREREMKLPEAFQNLS